MLTDIMHSLSIEPLAVLTQAVGFLLLLWLVKQYGLAPLFRMLDDRQAEIKSTYDQLDADRDAMQKTRAEYEARLAGIEAQAREQIAGAVKEAQELRTHILADAQKQAETILEKGRVEAERERQIAFLEMRRQLVDITLQAAGKVINETLDAKKHQALVDEFIGSVGVAPTQATAPSSNGSSRPNGSAPGGPVGNA
ncbi:MAG: F0F1 ATP synthase subunit B [Capsulimonadaceae bacterium]|nr:F0F1 ATP synthase subunit B [Capsulimonadaceae bacterium]